MKVNVDCKAVIFVTDNQGLKKYYASHFTSPGVCDSKGYSSLAALCSDMTGLDPISNLWTGLSGFSAGAPNIPEGEEILAQVGFKGVNDIGNGTGDSVLIVVKKQGSLLQLLSLASGTPKTWMQNAGL